MLQELSLEFFRGLAQPEPSYPTKKNSKAPSSRIALFTIIHYSKLLNVCQGSRRGIGNRHLKIKCPTLA
ncbi:MAG: hypothetical protein COX90_03495 [Candidatus Nealsonbacteria bacterium CG_4_10_14_0_2_um_filter_38_17]|uniref:Uncharacterized protein n=2 Tax=Candidatus Nealsoniibacteriota TaxID=1817911 RepID=A0A2M7UXC5_9BACT|nr:MAG: hypothetical protein COX36_03750 [Candidatus Nealsonbacteria bacterium CG23_combo_of_CG06-09_8_20_14_all_38_19]PIZ88626.1 MAG: hypothetical protein COX90_03495 [Candidatus Nealsonbacteria bacterium CG_4_10_14_0_2_um_filter_38_17]